MFNRRKFLASAAALSCSAGLPACSAKSSKSNLATESADVVVIGGGLAGLHAAMILKEQGLRPIVLEANTIVGGRVRSHSGVDGVVDVGGSQIGRSYARVIDTARKLGLNLIPEDQDLLTFGAHYKGSWIDNATWASNPLNKCIGAERDIPPMFLGQRLVSKYNPLKEIDDWLDPKFSPLDISMRELLRSHNHSAQAMELAALYPPGLSIDGTSVLRTWQEDTRGIFDRQFGPTEESAAPAGRERQFGEAHRLNLVNGLTTTSNIEGGCHRLPAAMAEALGDSVRLGKKVARIELSDARGVVTCVDGSTFKGRFIVSAIPFTMLRQVVIEGGEGGPTAEAIAHMPYVNTARMYLSVEPFWLEDGLPPSFATDGSMGMFWAIGNKKEAGTNRAMIVLTGPAATAIGEKRDGAEAFLLAELARIRPASAGKVRVETYKDWGRDPLQLGCSFSFAPGQVNSFARTMTQPWKIMHFAGEHTRRLDFGMEAAMESGERAALEIFTRA